MINDHTAMCAYYNVDGLRKNGERSILYEFFQAENGAHWSRYFYFTEKWIQSHYTALISVTTDNGVQKIICACISL